MTYFKLDIPKVNEAVSRYKNIKKDCVDDINLIYNGFKYTDSAWNDFNSIQFMEKTKKDKYNLTEYMTYIDNLYNEISKFNSNIDSILYKQGCKKGSVFFKFDDSYINECIKYFNMVITLMNDSLDRINITAFKPDFEYLGLVYTLRSEIYSIRSAVTDLINDLNSFVSSINNEINDSRYRMKRIDNYDFNLKTINYKWKTTDLDIKSIKQEEIQDYSKINKVKIDTVIKDNKISTLSPIYNVDDNKIKLDDLDNPRVTNVSLGNINRAEIEFDDIQKVSIQNNNAYNGVNPENNINFDADIDQKIGYNTNFYTPNNSNIDNNISFDTNDLNYDTSYTNANQSKISFESVKTNNLNDGIVDFRVNNNNINYNIDNKFNISDNISSFEANTTNINVDNIGINNYDLGSNITYVEAKPTNIATDFNNNINLDLDIKKMESLNDDLNT